MNDDDNVGVVLIISLIIGFIIFVIINMSSCDKQQKQLTYFLECLDKHDVEVCKLILDKQQ